MIWGDVSDLFHIQGRITGGVLVFLCILEKEKAGKQ